MNLLDFMLPLAASPGSTGGDVSSIENAWRALQALPGLSLALALIAVAGGTTLWLAGARIIRPVGAIVGGLLGATLGSGVIAGFLSDRTSISGIPVIAMLLGGLLGAFAGLLAYRLICAGLAGTCVATLVLLATLGAMSKSMPEVEVTSAPSEWRLTSLLGSGARAEQAADARSPLRESDEETSLLRGVVPQAALDRWDALSSMQRSSALVVASLAGILAGFAGLVAPKRSSAFTASILGSGIALAGLAWLTQRTALDAGQTLAPWLIAWGLLALLGLAVQSGGDKKEPASA